MVKTPIFKFNRQLEEFLHTVEIEHGFVRYTIFDDKLRAFVADLRKHEPWRQYLTTSNIYSILISEVTAAVRGRKLPELSKLRDVLTAGQLSDLKDRIKLKLESVPRNYELWLELPSVARWGYGEIELSKNISLFECAKEDLPGDSANMFDSVSRENLIYLKIKCRGYGDDDIESTAVSSGLSTAKQFLQIGSRLFNFRTSPFNALMLPLPDLHCFLLDTESTEISEIFPPPPLEDFLKSASINETKLEVLGEGPTLLSGKIRPANTRDEKIAALTSTLSHGMRLLDLSESESDATRICTALEWLFEGSNNQNQTLAFLQVCIGLEALLGDDKEDEPLTARLADRCAYLLGKVESERKEIRINFKEIYTTRSKLVHGRKARLETPDEGILSRARHLLSRVVETEMWNLRRALAKK